MTRTLALTKASRRRAVCFLSIKAVNVPRSIRKILTGGGLAGNRNPIGTAVAREVVEMETTSAPDAVSDAGLKLHEAPLGRPAHVNVTVPAVGARVSARL